MLYNRGSPPRRIGEVCEAIPSEGVESQYYKCLHNYHLMQSDTYQQTQSPQSFLFHQYKFYGIGELRSVSAVGGDAAEVYAARGGAAGGVGAVPLIFVCAR